MVTTTRFPTPAVSLTKHPATLPEADIFDEIDHAHIVESSLKTLLELSHSDLTDNVIWRDSLAFTGTLRTFYSPETVLATWHKLVDQHQPTGFEFSPNSSHVFRLGQHCWVEGRFTFYTQGSTPARCSGLIGLVPVEDIENSPCAWKIWLLSTILEQPDGFPDVDHLHPATAPKTELSTMINGSYPTHVDCLVVGAGIAGLSMAGRLQALGLSYLVIEKHTEVGDNWLKDRYESLKLHTSKEYNQLPGEPRTFRPQDPYNLSTSDVAEGFQRYIKIFGIHVLSSTTLVAGSYDSVSKTWSLELKRNGQSLKITAAHVVLATGNRGARPEMPTYPDRHLFKGDVIHGMYWRNGMHWQGKRGIVIGSANTAHGLIADMAKADFESITMIQRSKTFLLPTSTFGALVDPVYNERQTIESGDRILLGYPLPIQRLIAMAGIKMCAESEGNKDYFERIEAGGSNAERNGDLWGMMYDREGGHFFDLGAGELIANGTVKVTHALPVAYTKTGLALNDGTRLEADVIVFCTGYSGSIKETAADIFGPEVAETLEEFWQCDEEGESRGAWKYTGHPALWYTGHGYAHARYYSRFVAMHIKADINGTPIQIYDQTAGLKNGE